MLGPAGQSMGRACLDETTPRPSAPEGLVCGQRHGSDPRSNAIINAQRALGTTKIDPLMAAFNAVAWMASNPASTQPSIFWL